MLLSVACPWLQPGCRRSASLRRLQAAGWSGPPREGTRALGFVTAADLVQAVLKWQQPVSVASALPFDKSILFKPWLVIWGSIQPGSSPSGLGPSSVEGEYHWHKHDEEDQFFFVVEGLFLIDLEGRTVELGPRQGLMVPRGVVHRTRAPERTVILMVEPATVVPTGN